MEVAGRISNEQDVVKGIFIRSGGSEHFGFRTGFLPADGRDSVGDVVFLPFAVQGNKGGIGDDNEIGAALKKLKALKGTGHGGQIVNNFPDGLIDTIAPSQDFFQFFSTGT